MTLDALETLVRARRSTRHFKPDPIDPELLDRLLDLTRWAPSGYNLQPIHFTAVTDAALRAELLPACLDQTQVKQAPCVVVFSGDRRVVAHHLEKVFAADLACGGINEAYDKRLRSLINLSFGHGPAGLGWLWKALLIPVLHLLRPLFDLPAVHMKLWLTRQAPLSVMTFLLAAEAAGLATIPMEGFDASRLAKILRMPPEQEPILIVPVGYSASTELKRTRLPLADLKHTNRWG